MKLSELIAQLQSLQTQHGDMQVVKIDRESYVEVVLDFKVQKVFEDQPGHLSTFDDEAISERRQTAREVYPEITIREWYTKFKEEMAEEGVEYTETYEQYRDNMWEVALSAADTVRKYEMAPLMVVF